MDKKLDTLYDLCETVSKELESANEKINGAGGELSAGDLEYLDKLTHTMKSLKTTIAMIEAEVVVLMVAAHMQDVVHMLVATAEMMQKRILSMR